MYKKKDQTQGEFLYEQLLSNRWEVKDVGGSKLRYQMKCPNPKCPGHKTKKYKMAFGDNGSGNCFYTHEDCGGFNFQRIVLLLQQQGVDIRSTPFDCNKKSDTQKYRFDKIKYIDVVNPKTRLEIEYNNLLLSRKVDPVWFQANFPPVELSMTFFLKDREGNIFPRVIDIDRYFMWQIYDGSFAGRAIFGEEFFTNQGEDYKKYIKYKNEGSFSTIGLTQVLNKKPDRLFVVEGYFDYFPFPEGVAIGIGSQRPSRHDLRTLASMIDVREVVYIPDADVSPSVRLQVRKELSDIFFVDAEVWRIKNLFPDLEAKDMSDVFCSNMNRDEILAKLKIIIT